MLADAIVGATRPWQIVTWTHSDRDSTPEDLTGATLTGKIQNAAGVSRSIAGTLTVTGAEAGVFRWEYASGDIVTAGTYSVQFTATFVAAPTVARTLASQWVVRPAL